MAFLALLISFSLFGQRTVLESNRGILTNPQVSITMDTISTDHFTASFTPNAECSHYYCLAMSDADISMWTTMMGMTVEQLTVQWGLNATGSTSHTWTDMTPGTHYTVFALAYGTDSVAATACDSVSFYTLTTGGSGASVITIQVSNIKDTSALVVCTPNDQTALFYDGIITVDYYNQIGQDSVVKLFKQNPPFYATDTWEWLTLTPSTNYYVVAFGQNASQQWGEVALFPFTTLDGVGITTHQSSDIKVYPVPSNGTFQIESQEINGGRAEIYSTTGQLMETYSISNGVTTIHSSLAAGNYFVRIIDNANKAVTTHRMIIKK